jgi:hypothetical protein
MPGKPLVYSPATADFTRFYAPHPMCKLWGWVPTDFDTMEDIPFVTFVPPGGWVSSDQHLQDQHDPNSVLPGTDVALFDLFIDAGFAVVFVEFPMGWQGSSSIQLWPAARFPFQPRCIGLAKAMLKTWGYRGDIVVGGDKVNLTYSDGRVIGAGSSAGAIMETWISGLLDGAIPYQRNRSAAHNTDEYTPWFSHRCAGIVNVDGIIDFARAEHSGPFAPNAVVYAGDPKQWASSPAWTDVPLWLKKAMSPIYMIERNAPENKSLGYVGYFPTTGATGNLLGNPALTKAQALAIWDATDDQITLAGDPNNHYTDVHECLNGAVLERLLTQLRALNGQPAGYRFKIWWGNDVNNPAGNWAIGAGTPTADFYNHLVPWATTELGITPA